MPKAFLWNNAQLTFEIYNKKECKQKSQMKAITTNSNCNISPSANYSSAREIPISIRGLSLLQRKLGYTIQSWDG
jgi:hypothetical protein